VLSKIPEETDGWPTATKPLAPLIDVFPSSVQPAPSPANALIPREQFARVPVPEGFNTNNLSAINKGNCSDSIEASPSLPGHP
jgi:hypothetical protein